MISGISSGGKCSHEPNRIQAFDSTKAPILKGGNKGIINAQGLFLRIDQKEDKPRKYFPLPPPLRDMLSLCCKLYL